MEAREQEFLDYVQSGGLVETDDWMPDEYRKRLIKFIEMHGNSELMGVLPERDWILRAPTLQRKLALTAKIQDEVGHCQLIYRAVARTRQAAQRLPRRPDLGQVEVPQRLPLPDEELGDVGVIAWLVDAAAIISQKALLKCSYAPYARVMKKVWEESFHILHGRDTVLAMVTGTPQQFELVQEALHRWWEPLMHFHGTPIPAEEDPMVIWCIKSQGNESARQQFLDGYVPQILELGLEIPDPKLRKRDDGVWEYTEPDWDKLIAVVTGHGPASQERLDFRRLSRRDRVGVEGRPRRGSVIFEVFRQERKGQPFVHGGSFHAPDQAFADAYAREFYARRQESVALWVVPRDSIHVIEEFPDEFDLKYRRVDGYSIKARLKEA